MAKGAVRGALGAVLGLATLDALLSNHGTQATSGALNFTNSVVRRALSPDVALIPNFAAGQGGGSGTPNAIGGTNPDYSKPYLPSNAVIQSRPDQLPVNGHPTPS